MLDLTHHDRLMCKLQYFADMLNQARLEKQALAIVVVDENLKKELKNEIFIYDEIISQYDQIFNDILHR